MPQLIYEAFAPPLFKAMRSWGVSSLSRLKFIAFAITRRASGVKGFKTGGTGVLGGGGAANSRIVLCREMKKRH